MLLFLVLVVNSDQSQILELYAFTQAVRSYALLHMHTRNFMNTHILHAYAQGVAERDRLVFSEVRKRGIPIFMVTSGGYQVCTHDNRC